ncbi:hypothetical protein [Demequina sp.]|uniref:hypothetical protein n=1 Tax=Demequina sp. TaxID=2050685 RepID=UPI0025FF5E26|nr:hypothetical protein [Demequina sp.]
MSEPTHSRRTPSVASMVLTLIGIAVGVGLVFLGSRMDSIELLGLTVSPALPMLLTYVAGMLVGRFGNARR